MRLIFAYLLTSSFVIADESQFNAQQWLENMSQSMSQLNYQGTVAFFKNGRLDAMKYYHVVDNGKEQERLLSLNSPMREVIREAGKVRCVFKKSKKVVIDHRPINESFIVDLPDDFSEAKSVYEFSLLGNESVAMLSSQIVSIVAKDNFRYGRKIWIDKESSLPLKIEVYDLSGLTLEQVVFTDLKVGNQVLFSPIEYDEQASIQHIHQLETQSIDEAGFVIEKIPAGFKIVFFTKMTAEKTTQTVEHIFLSDGFSSVSVYREIKASDVKEGLLTLGSVNSFTHIIGDYQITAMGEVPAETVKFIAQGAKFR